MEQLPAVLLLKILNDVPVYERGKLYCLNKAFYKLLKENEKFEAWHKMTVQVRTIAYQTLKIVEEGPRRKEHQLLAPFWFDEEGEVIMYRELLGQLQPLWIYKDTFGFLYPKKDTTASKIRLSSNPKPIMGYVTTEENRSQKAGAPDLRLTLSFDNTQNKQRKSILKLCPAQLPGSLLKKSTLYFFLCLLYKKYNAVFVIPNVIEKLAF